MPESTNAGKLEIEGVELVYVVAGVSWRVRLDDMVVVGEYTNAGGPWFDDWFLIFGYREKGRTMLREIPVPSGLEELLVELGNKLGSDAIQLRLVGSTEWASRVLWPQSLCGEPFYVQADRKGKRWNVNPAVLALK